MSSNTRSVVVTVAASLAVILAAAYFYRSGPGHDGRASTNGQLSEISSSDSAPDRGVSKPAATLSSTSSSASKALASSSVPTSGVPNASNAAQGRTTVLSQASPDARPPAQQYIDRLLDSNAKESNPAASKFHDDLLQEKRKADWAAPTEFQLQSGLQQIAPELTTRLELGEVACATTMCEMQGSIKFNSPDQASQDMDDLQEYLQQMRQQAGWKQTGLGAPDVTVSATPDGRPIFIAQFNLKH